MAVIKQEAREQGLLIDRFEELLRRLARNRDMLKAVMENTGTMLVFLDPEFNFVFVNSAYVRGCGYSEDYLIGKNSFALFPALKIRPSSRKCAGGGKRPFSMTSPSSFQMTPGGELPIGVGR